MRDNAFDRREALQIILKSVALAAGISVADLTMLLDAQAGRVRRATGRLSKSVSATKLKMLQVKLSGFNRNVFQSNFGRTTPLIPAKQMHVPGNMHGGMMAGMGCPVHMMGGMGHGASPCPQFSVCGSNGGSCPSLDLCQENVCSGQDYGGGSGGSGSCTDVNDCNSQDCGSLATCGDNECTDQDCPNLQGCGINKTNLVGLLNQFQTNSYIKGLMQHFHTANTTQLAARIQNAIRQRRFVTPNQVLKPGAVRPKRPSVRPKAY
jgi:hypothetical protein